MRTKLALFTLIGLAVLACHTSKKTTTSTAEIPKTATTITTVATTSSVTTAVLETARVRKAFDGVYEPGEEELTAIKPEYKDATIEQLKEGYTLYAKSACISCHAPVNIYAFPNEKWPAILQSMSYEAKLTAAQKDAVTKYVYAIKAADPFKK